MRTAERMDGRAAPELDPPSAGELVPTGPLVLVQEGFNRRLVPSIGLALFVLAFVAALGADALGWMDTGAEAAMAWSGIAVLATAGGVSARRVLRYRREYVLDADGISLWRSDPYPDTDEWVRIAWDDIAGCSASAEPELCTLTVLDSRLRHVLLREAPARPETVAFVRRVQDEAGRHPRAVLAPAPTEPRGTPFLGIHTLVHVGGMAAAAWGSVTVARMLGVARTPGLLMVTAVLALLAAYGAWTQLDDPDLAHADRGGRGWKPRLRTALRRRLGIRHL